MARFVNTFVPVPRGTLVLLCLLLQFCTYSEAQRAECDASSAHRDEPTSIWKIREKQPALTLNDFANCPARRTDFSQSSPRQGYRTNSHWNFCLISKDSKEPPEDTAEKIPYGGIQDPKRFPILEQLLKYNAWSNQPSDDLPFSIGDPENKYAAFGYPKHGAHNPYYVEVTGISVKGDLLHNWLHFRVFMNQSESMGFEGEGFNAVQQGDRDRVLNADGSRERVDNAAGRISALLMMVKDQDGWPIGDFSQDIPCHRTCSQYPVETYYGDKSNAVPCAYTPPRATSHPGMFIFDAHPGFYTEDETSIIRPGKPTTPTTEKPEGPPDPTESPEEGPAPPPESEDPVTPDPAPENKTVSTRIPPLEFKVPEKTRKSVREVHATWSFNQNTCNFASKIYIQTLILEDVRHPLTARYRPVPPETDPEKGKLPNAGNADPKLFGWSAQYNILLPTKSSLGAADYVNLKYLKERDLRTAEIDCHVPMFDAPKTSFNGFLKGHVPQHNSENPVPVPSVQQYIFGLYEVMGTDKQYYGQHETQQKCNGAGSAIPDDDPSAKKKDVSTIPTVTDFIANKDNAGIRCPCPQVPSTLPPENQTLDPSRTHARLIHASHMAIAYMLLTPLACFVARYYKETFVTVFCFQEYWWYMWHVVILIIACVFNFGAILSIVRRKDTELKLSDNVIVHKILGSMSIFVFYMEIFTGFFRVADPQKRLRQIFMHWLIGVMNNVCAVGSMFAMAWVDQSGMSCSTVYTILIWLLFVIIFYVIMEIDMRRTDKKMNLVPKRSYLPPPVVRLFTRDAPGRNFRMIILGIFVIGLIVLQFLVSYFIWHSGGDSCSQEFERFLQSASEIDDTADNGGDYGGGDDYVAE